MIFFLVVSPLKNGHDAEVEEEKTDSSEESEDQNKELKEIKDQMKEEFSKTFDKPELRILNETPEGHLWRNDKLYSNILRLSIISLQGRRQGLDRTGA